MSFDNVKVGKLIGQGEVDCIAAWRVKDPNILVMDGDPTDNNAKLFAEGYNGVLKPNFDDGAYMKVGEPAGTWTPPTRADDVRAAVHGPPEHQRRRSRRTTTTPTRSSRSCRRNQIPPKTFPTTGQDASPSGLQNILKGYQCGTVYKPIYLEAQAAAALALYLRAGEKPPAALVNGTTPDSDGEADVASVLLDARSGSRPTTWPTPSSRTVRSRSPTSAPAACQRVHCRRHQLTGDGTAERSQRLGPAGHWAGTASGAREPTSDRRLGRRGEPLLELAGIGKHFGPVQALVGVDLDVPAGQVTALVGDNGAGKSVLIKCIAGHPHARRRPDPLGGPAGPHPDARAMPPRSGSRPSTRTSRSATTSTSSRTCSSGANAYAALVLDEEAMETAASETLSEPGGHDRALDPPAGRVALGRPAPVGRDRQGRAVELEAGHHGRADRRARRGADARWCSISCAGSPTAGSPC